MELQLRMDEAIRHSRTFRDIECRTMQVLQDSEVKIMQGKITIYLILLSINLTSTIVPGNAVLAMTINDRA